MGILRFILLPNMVSSNVFPGLFAGECLSIREEVKMPTQSVCTRCGHVSSQEVCKACVLLEGLNKGKPKLGIGKSSKVTQKMKTDPTNLVGNDEPNQTQPSPSLPDSVTNKLKDISINGNESNVTNGIPVDSLKTCSDDSVNSLNMATVKSSGIKAKKIFSPPKAKVLSANSENSDSGKCASKITSIEDIGSGRACQAGGQCSGDCEGKKTRKVISLRDNPSDALKTAGLSKKDLDF